MINLRKLILELCKNANYISPSWLADTIEQCQTIELKIKLCHNAMDDKENKHRKAIQKHKEEIRDIQKTCLHQLTTYYPDASGNNDSSTVCDICGKEL